MEQGTIKKQNESVMVPLCTSFVGLDSDGCVVDTMAAKQHGFLQPMLVKSFGLEAMADVYCACADFVNLYSVTRGITRFKSMLLNFECFNRHPAVIAADFPRLPTEALRAFTESGLPMGDAALVQWLETHRSSSLEKLLEWSRAVNRAILDSGVTFPAYEGAREALKRMWKRSDTGVVSQSPERVLEQDWGSQQLLPYVGQIAGQELGDKVHQLTVLTEGKYLRERVLMIGDAPGDLAAAKAFGCRFYPILPGREEASWARFNETIYDAFYEERYTYEQEAICVAEFERVLPSVPPWEQ
ncbi:MAG: HAD hydrolase-like protein [Kiritimatiellia bacterium]